MAKIVGLPRLSPTMEEGTLVRWVKAEGDHVEVDELLAEVETDKATMEFRSFDKGVLLKILASEGDTLEPDTPVAIIGEEGEDISALVAEAQAGGGKPAESSGGGEGGKPAEGGEATESGKAAGEEKASRAGEQAEEAEEAKEAPEAQEGDEARAGEPSTSKSEGGRILASPFVRKLAREHEVDLSQVSGSGPGGRIIKSDFDRHLAKGPAQAPAARGERPAPRIEKASSMRRTIARRLVESKREVPHYYLTIDVDAGPLVQARADINAMVEEDGDKVSVNDLIIKACAVALHRYPRANASWVDKAIHHHQRVDISVAVAVEEGLLTPVIRDADHKGVVDIAREMRELAGRAKEKKLAPEEMTDGTFSVSNLGMFGIEDFSAVINPPEGAILAVGTVREEPVVREGRVEPGKRMRMTMSCDHRVIDGAVGARFLQVLREVLEHPATLAL